MKKLEHECGNITKYGYHYYEKEKVFNLNSCCEGGC